MPAAYIFMLLSMIAMNVFLFGMGIYYAYMYYIHIYKSEERMLRVTNIEIHRNRNGSRYYYVIGELVDMPGEQLKSLDTYSLRSQQHFAGDIIPVRYAGTRRFAVDPQKMLHNAVILIIVAVALIFIGAMGH